MKSYLLIFLIISSLLLSCSETDKLYFCGSPNVVFGSDSVEFNWLKIRNNEFTCNVKCKLVGNALDEDTEFKIKIVEEQTTATEGKTYVNFPETYVWPKGEFVFYIPIKFINEDINTLEKKVALTIEMLGSDTLETNFVDGALKHKIIISGMIKKPIYWDKYNLKRYFGEYSKVKHKIIIDLMGKDFPEMKAWRVSAGVWINRGLTMINEYFIENEVIDEYGNIIQPWI